MTVDVIDDLNQKVPELGRNLAAVAVIEPGGVHHLAVNV